MKLPFVVDVGPVNTWPGEFQVTKVIDLFAFSIRPERKCFSVYLIICNVGLRLCVESRKQNEERIDRYLARAIKMINEGRK